MIDIAHLRDLYAAAILKGDFPTWESVDTGMVASLAARHDLWNALPGLLDELEAARKVVEAARDMVRTEKSYERDVFRAACRAYDDAVKP